MILQGRRAGQAGQRKPLRWDLTANNTTADKLDLTLMYNTNAGHQAIAEAIQQMWKDTLGLNVKVVNQEWKVYLVTTQSLDTPQIFRLGWCLDYPDANNFDKDVFSVGGNANPVKDGKPAGGVEWNDPAYEALVKQAATETDPAKRVDLYAQAEQILVKTDAVVAPIYWYTTLNMTKPYIQRTHGQGSREAYEKWDILPH